MISLKQYRCIFPVLNQQVDHQGKLSTQKQQQSKIPFTYLYPYECAQGSSVSNLFVNQKQELFSVTELQSLQECEKIDDLVRRGLVALEQDVWIVQKTQHNPRGLKGTNLKHNRKDRIQREDEARNEDSEVDRVERKYLAISAWMGHKSLQKVAEEYFYEGVIVPSEQFCTCLVQRVILFTKMLQQKGIVLKVITPQHIIISNEQIYLNYPFPHSIKAQPSEQQLCTQLKPYEYFCAPELLKLLSNQSQKSNEKGINSNKKMLRFAEESMMQDFTKNKVSVDNMSMMGLGSHLQNYSNMYEQGKQYPKAILYSLALCVFYCFGFHIFLEDRYKGLKNPRTLNKYLDSLRKQIKTYHDGMFISKLLKLMLEHSQSLRDSTNTFTYKMNSVQFKLLKKKAKAQNGGQYTLKTQSEACTNNPSNPNIVDSASGKKTIDIRISSMSNCSSSISRSWLSISHSNQNIEKGLSPYEVNKSQEKDKSLLKMSRRSPGVVRELNEILEEGDEKEGKYQVGEKMDLAKENSHVLENEPVSPIELDICSDQDEQGYTRAFEASRQQETNHSQRQKKMVLLNKISQKQEAEQEFDETRNHAEQRQIVKSNNSIGCSIQQNKSHISTSQKNSEINISLPSSIINESQLQDELHYQDLGLQNKLQNRHGLSRTEKGLSEKKQSKINDYRLERKVKGNRLSGSDGRFDQKHDRSINGQQERENQTVTGNKNDEVSMKQDSDVVDLECQVQEGISSKKAVSFIHQKHRKTKAPQTSQQPASEKQIQPNPNEPSTLCLFSNSSPDPCLQLNSNFPSPHQQNYLSQPHLQESYIFEQSFQPNDHEYRMEQELLKQNKNKEKLKLTSRKKDMYNSRAKLVLSTLAGIYAVFWFIEWILGKKDQ